MPQPPETNGDDSCQRWWSHVAPWHRPDGPSFVGRPFGFWSFFRYVWTNEEGQRHRYGGPVEARSDGTCLWAKNGEETKIGGVHDGKWVELEVGDA